MQAKMYMRILFLNNNNKKKLIDVKERKKKMMIINSNSLSHIQYNNEWNVVTVRFERRTLFICDNTII